MPARPAESPRQAIAKHPFSLQSSALNAQNPPFGEGMLLWRPGFAII
jgi:hypothetical protein